MLRDSVTSDTGMVTIEVQLADRTRRAQVRVPRRMTGSELVRTCRKKWALSLDVDYQLFHLRTNRLLLSKDTLAADSIHPGDTLILQPFPMHGAC